MSNEHLNIKVFIGWWYHGEIKGHLKQSTSWKNAQILKQGLIFTKFQDKEYIGQFYEFPLDSNELKNLEQELKKNLQTYCPKLNIDTQSIYLFPQVFLS